MNYRQISYRDFPCESNLVLITSQFSFEREFLSKLTSFIMRDSVYTHLKDEVILNGVFFDLDAVLVTSAMHSHAVSLDNKPCAKPDTSRGSFIRYCKRDHVRN